MREFDVLGGGAFSGGTYWNIAVFRCACCTASNATSFGVSHDGEEALRTAVLRRMTMAEPFAQEHAVMWVTSWLCIVSGQQTKAPTIGNSDVIVDEELLLSSYALADLLQTRIGGRRSMAQVEELQQRDSGKGHGNSVANPRF